MESPCSFSDMANGAPKFDPKLNWVKESLIALHRLHITRIFSESIPSPILDGSAWKSVSDIGPLIEDLTTKLSKQPNCADMSELQSVWNEWLEKNGKLMCERLSKVPKKSQLTRDICPDDKDSSVSVELAFTTKGIFRLLPKNEPDTDTNGISAIGVKPSKNASHQRAVQRSEAGEELSYVYVTVKKSEIRVREHGGRRTEGAQCNQDILSKTPIDEHSKTLNPCHRVGITLDQSSKMSHTLPSELERKTNSADIAKEFVDRLQKHARITKDLLDAGSSLDPIFTDKIEWEMQHRISILVAEFIRKLRDKRLATLREKMISRYHMRSNMMQFELELLFKQYLRGSCEDSTTGKSGEQNNLSDGELAVAHEAKNIDDFPKQGCKYCSQLFKFLRPFQLSLKVFRRQTAEEWFEEFSAKIKKYFITGVIDRFVSQVGVAMCQDEDWMVENYDPALRNLFVAMNTYIPSAIAHDPRAIWWWRKDLMLDFRKDIIGEYEDYAIERRMEEIGLWDQIPTEEEVYVPFVPPPRPPMRFLRRARSRTSRNRLSK